MNSIAIGFMAGLALFIFWAGAFESRRTPIIDAFSIFIASSLFGIVVGFFYAALSIRV